MSVDKSKVLIQVQDMKKAFGSNQVLDGISTDICQGEVVAIIGPSGSVNPLSFVLSTFWRSLQEVKSCLKEQISQILRLT